MILHILRHGRTQANSRGLLLGRADPALDELGEAQALRAAGAVGNVDRIVSSPLLRTDQTARSIAAANGSVEVVHEDRFLEMDYGEWDLLPLKEIAPQTWAQWQADSDFAPPKGESLNQLGSRVRSGLDLFAEESKSQPDARVVLVTHVSPIKAAVAWALNVDISVSWRMFVQPASLTTLRITDGVPTLLSFNDTAHLEGL